MVSLGQWYHSDFRGDYKKFYGFEISPFRIFLTFAGVLLPQVFISFVLSSAYAAKILQQRVRGDDRKKIAQRFCPMVVWIGIDDKTYKAFFKDTTHEFLLRLFERERDEADRVERLRQPSMQDAQLIEVKEDWRYLCCQDWDAKNLLWKEAMLNTRGVLPKLEDMHLEPSRTGWECAVVAFQSLGSLTSVFSRYAGGLEASTVELMSSWISVNLLLQVLIVPRLVVFCKRGICVSVNEEKFAKLVRYCEEGQEEHKIGWRALSLLVLVLLFLFILFFLLIPPLIYFFYKRERNVLGFVSLIPFTLLSGVGIVSFCLTLPYSPHEVLFGFATFPGITPPQAIRPSKYLPVISVVILLLGVMSYVFAVIDTVLNWQFFSARDCYVYNYILPHIG